MYSGMIAFIVTVWLMGFFFSFGIIGLWMILIHHQYLHFASITLNGVACVFLVTLGTALFTGVINGSRIRESLFPKGSFCIGDGTARYKRMIERRRLFGLSALVALAIVWDTRELDCQCSSDPLRSSTSFTYVRQSLNLLPASIYEYPSMPSLLARHWTGGFHDGAARPLATD